MRRLCVVLGTCVALSLAPGCSGGGDGGGEDEEPLGPVATELQGTWVLSRCSDPYYPPYTRDIYRFVGMTWEEESYTYFGQALCEGQGSRDSHDIGTYAIGAPVSATLYQGGTVTAHEYDLTLDYLGTYYGVLYVDTSTVPHQLQTSAFTTAAASRPTELNGWIFVKQ